MLTRFPEVPEMPIGIERQQTAGQDRLDLYSDLRLETADVSRML